MTEETSSRRGSILEEQTWQSTYEGKRVHSSRVCIASWTGVCAVGVTTATDSLREVTFA